MGRISFTLVDLQKISYFWGGNWRVKIRYLFINSNNNRAQSPGRNKRGRKNEERNRIRNMKKSIRGSSSSRSSRSSSGTGEATNITSVYIISLSLDYDTMAMEILSRLPVKSLMRFKCVCKHWRSLIEDDPQFIDLHLTRSKTHPGLFMNLPVKPSPHPSKQVRKGEELVLLLADLFQDHRPVAVVNTTRKTNSLHYDKFLGPVNGLICFIDSSVYAVQIYNVCTREVTPWISSQVFMDEKRMTNSGKYLVVGGVNYQFGFDPITKEHKVVFGWKILNRIPCQVCEVLTVGDNTWRIIDEVPLFPLCGHGINGHANGSMYWYVPYWGHSDGLEIELNDNPMEDVPEFLVVFDIGSEKFRTIKIPRFTNVNNFDGVHALLEVDAGIAILRRYDHCFKMWIFDDCDKENGPTINSMSDKLWSNVGTITLPLPFYLCCNQPFYFHSISGTDQIIIETKTETLRRRKKCYEEMWERLTRLTWIYSYNWKDNTTVKVDIRAISSSIPSNFNWAAELCSTFVESLLPVRKKLQHHGSHPPQEK